MWRQSPFGTPGAFPAAWQGWAAIGVFLAVLGFAPIAHRAQWLTIHEAVGVMGIDVIALIVVTLVKGADGRGG